MTRDSFVALVGNATLLLLLVYVRDLLNAFHWVSRPWIRQVIAGIAIGAIGIFVMLMPWTFATGIIFDTRSVLLAAGECACLTKPIDVKGFLKMVAEERG